MTDALIGANTLQILNRTKRHKMLQIAANLERLRWVDQSLPDRFVVVNIPAATLWAVDKGQVALEMPVIVGHPGRRTQPFITEIRGVRFNPDWTVPPTIKRFDILPKVQEDLQYLQNKGIELIRGYGAEAETLDPQSIDWANISWRELNSIRMVQTPGEHNPLGRVRVLMPNEYNIYLHDTNHPELFASPERAASSGCVRMKYPEKMAQFILSGENSWQESMLVEKLADYKTRDIYIENRIPVYLLYYTIWIDEQGRVVYGTDIYNRDKKLINALADIDGLLLPGDNRESSARQRAAPSLVSSAQ